MDFTEKTKIIEAIKSEVNELHPLLRDLCLKLPHINHVEYTHGSNEKGADLILTRHDQTLETDSYIGLIAKRGKISSDLGEISRQIEECVQQRHITGGKRTVRLTEIWVINTATISSNAKDKISDNYAKQKIEFIDGEKLAALVDRHLPHFWHQVPTVLGSYLATLKEEIEKLDLETSIIGNTSTGFYIEPDVQEVEKTTYVKSNVRSKRPRLVNLTDEVLTSRVTLLEGELGFGKSRTARMIARHYCGADIYKSKKIIPIYEQFRRFVEQYKSIDDLIVKKLAQLAGVRDAGSQILVILDGIDEITTGNAWKNRLKEAISDVKGSADLCLFMTTRPLKIIDEQQDLYSGVKQYMLRPLSLAKTILFVKQACKDISVSTRLYEDLAKSDLFKQLPQSPIAASLLSSLIAQNQHDLPSNLTELYSKSIEYMLGRWDVQKGRATEKEYQAAERVTLQITEYMIQNELIWMSYPEARSIVEEWHRKRNTGVNLEGLIERVFKTSGIFYHDSSLEIVSFRHRSFGEYLYARHVKNAGGTLRKEYAFDAYWSSIMFFYIGLLRDCGDLLEDLYKFPATNELEAWMKIITLPNYSLAGYETEYTVVEENLPILLQEAAELYLKIRNGGTDTKLVELPEMHLLWLFQRIIRASFDYNYLAPAVLSTIVKIDEYKGPTDVKMYALFFAACFAAQLGKKDGVEYLLKNYRTDEMPLPVAMGVQFEVKYDKDFQKLSLVKAHEKRLMKLIQSNRPKASGLKSRTDSRLEEMFERPLKQRKFVKLGSSR